MSIQIQDSHKRSIVERLLRARRNFSKLRIASYAQQRLWFIDQLEPGRATYNVPTAVRLEGALDFGALRRCVQGIVRRHEVLRTSFVMVSDELRQMGEEAGRWAMRVVDLSGLGARARELAAEEQARREARRPFVLSRGPLMRTIVLRLGQQDHVLLATMHHIVSDGWSKGILIRELTTLYEA